MAWWVWVGGVEWSGGRRDLRVFVSCELGGGEGGREGETSKAEMCGRQADKSHHERTSGVAEGFVASRIASGVRTIWAAR